MIALARRLLGDERVRFLMIGGFNTVFGYALFALLYLLFGAVLPSVVCVYLSYAIAVPLAFYLHRRFTFRANGAGNVGIDFLRFCIVYVIALVINTVALPLVVLTGVPTLLAQALVQAGTTILTYIGHKVFSFRRSRQESGEPVPIPAARTNDDSGLDVPALAPVDEGLERPDQV